MHRGSQTPLGSGASQQTSTPTRQPWVAPHLETGGCAAERSEDSPLDAGSVGALLQAMTENTTNESGSHVFMC
jgi:hypothetical protein